MISTMLTRGSDFRHTNDNRDLEFLDTIADGHKLTATPYETVLLDSTDSFLELSHVGFIVPRLDFEGNNRLEGRLVRIDTYKS